MSRRDPPDTLRILQVVTLSERGGAQRHVADVTKELVRRGHEVHLAAGPGGPLFDEVRAAGAATHVQERLIRRVDPRNDVAATRDLVRLVRALRPHVVHAHSSKAGVVARLAARLCRVPSVFTAHGFVFLEPLPKATRGLYLALEMVGGRLGNALIAVSEVDAAVARRLRLASRARIEFVPNGFDPQGPPPPRPPGPVFRFAAIANPYPTKGLDVLIEALRQPVLTGVDVNVVVAGDGAGLARLRDAARGLPIEFAGRVDDVPGLLASVHATVQPSVKEGWPYAVLEAMGAARPVVATDVGGMRAQLGGSECGWIVPPRDPAALAAAMAEAAADPDEAARRGGNARARVEREFGVARMVDAIEALYARIASRRVASRAV